MESIKNGKSIGLSAFVGKKIIGMSGIRIGPKKINRHVGNFGISIARDYRGEGIGRLLMDSVLKEAKKRLKNLRLVTLEVFEENHIARRMYEEYGFKQYGLLPKGLFYKGKFVNEILMQKMVKQN